ncbi:MAG: Fic family protein, partial [Candidatus Dadabacteria bacterium]|nr:Fic family protein [Candidatus Dadabacteria bacterium]
MEPFLVGETSRHRGELTDLAVELAQRAAGLRRGLPEGIVKSLSDLVRTMNCYYSNLIEGHDTHLTDIGRALKDDYSADTEKRNLQLEARAHIAVQKWIDEEVLKGGATAVACLQEIHCQFGKLLPQELLQVENPDTGEIVSVVPGELRDYDVRVGRHVPVSPGAVPRFMKRFESVYGNLGKTDAILASAAAHHRLLWIHPFLDGNGRVARLMSDAMLSEALDAVRIWSVSRGLVRKERE